MSSWRVSVEGRQGRSTIDGGAGALGLLSDKVDEARDEGRRLYVITDENVHRWWGQRLQVAMGLPSEEERVLVVAPGEDTKRPDMAVRCWEWLVASGAGRQDIVIAVGGGVIGDLAGFVAATFLRGVTLWQVPTTLLAQVDSSVGGKNAVNLSAGKNLVGTFFQPAWVLIDPELLSTLPEREFIGGLGEVVKYALLSGEADLAALEEGAEALSARDPETVSAVVRRCVQQKADVVQQDELDQGGRAVLNLGHTTAHALEQAAGYGHLDHGTAVGLGSLVALALSEEVLGLEPSIRERAQAVMRALSLPTKIELPPVGSLLRAASRDKKAVSGSSRFVLLAGVGAPVWGLEVSDGLFAQALKVIEA